MDTYNQFLTNCTYKLKGFPRRCQRLISFFDIRIGTEHGQRQSRPRSHYGHQYGRPLQGDYQFPHENNSELKRVSSKPGRCSSVVRVCWTRKRFFPQKRRKIDSKRQVWVGKADETSLSVKSPAAPFTVLMAFSHLSSTVPILT